MTSSFGNGAGGAPTYSFGSKKPVKQKFDNQEVLAALQHITGQQIGFDREAWKAWYVSEHTMDRYDVRSDEYIEFLNVGATPIDLSGARLFDVVTMRYWSWSWS